MAKVDVERRGSATIVWLNRPEVHNAIDTETARLLHGALVSARDDEETRVVVVSGRGGRSFSSGADLTDGANLFSGREDPAYGPLRFSGLDPGKPSIGASRGTASPAAWSWRAGAISGSPEQRPSSAC